MNIKALTHLDREWNSVIEYARNCSWRAGKSLSLKMEKQVFQDFERVVVVIDHDICGFCTITKIDCLENVPYTPYIGYVFVDEKYRGQRISEKLIDYCINYLKDLNFDKVYLISDHINFYEKYGFKVIDQQLSSKGNIEKIYMKEI